MGSWQKAMNARGEGQAKLRREVKKRGRVGQQVNTDRQGQTRTVVEADTDGVSAEKSGVGFREFP